MRFVTLDITMHILTLQTINMAWNMNTVRKMRLYSKSEWTPTSGRLHRIYTYIYISMIFMSETMIPFFVFNSVLLTPCSFTLLLHFFWWYITYICKWYLTWAPHALLPTMHLESALIHCRNHVSTYSVRVGPSVDACCLRMTSLPYWQWVLRSSFSVWSFCVFSRKELIRGSSVLPWRVYRLPPSVHCCVYRLRRGACLWYGICTCHSWSTRKKEAGLASMKCQYDFYWCRSGLICAATTDVSKKKKKSYCISTAWSLMHQGPDCRRQHKLGLGVDFRCTESSLLFIYLFL